MFENEKLSPISQHKMDMCTYLIICSGIALKIHSIWGGVNIFLLVLFKY